MKKITVVALVLLLILALDSFAISGNTPLFDGANLLSSSEEEEITKALNELKNRHKTDIAIYMEYEMTGSSAKQTAESIFENNGYGTDGILLYICVEEREYHITVADKEKSLFKSSEIDKIKTNIEKYLKKNNWYLACDAFSDTVSEIYESKNSSTETEKKTDWSGILTFALVPPVIALIAMLIRGRKMKTARRQNYASDYMNSGSFRLDVSRDIFLYSTITKTERPQPSSSGSRSSGRSYGGGGGRF